MKNLENLDRLALIERSIIKKYRDVLWTPFVRAIKTYELIQENDRIAVCVSGGKDSFILAKLMQEMYKHGIANFEVKFINMNPGYNEENSRLIEENAKILGIKLYTFHTDIFDTVNTVSSSPCYLCARMRRGNLYKTAQDLGCNKIALGHHFDDVIETHLMSILYSGQVMGMLPRLKSTNFDNMELIRPLYLVNEEDIISFSEYNKLKFIRCACRFTENNENDEDKSSKRLETRELIKELSKRNPFVRSNIFRSMENIQLDTMIGYKSDGEKHSFLERL